MSNELTAGKSFSLVPQNLNEAMKYSKMIADSDVVPKDFKGKPENVLVAIQMGTELGLPPLQAIQNISVINGRPAVYGDSLIAICRGARSCEHIVETFDESTMTATCRAKRKGEPEQSRTFDKTDAEVAGLWGKSGPWTQYPKRMLAMRARGFCLRDVFPDALRGVQLVEEVRDYQPAERDITSAKEAAPAIEHETKTESLSANLAGQAEKVEIVANEPDPALIAEGIKLAITNVGTPAEWNEAAAMLAENKEVLGGRYASLKKKCTDKKADLQKEGEALAKPPADDRIPGMDYADDAPKTDLDDPGF